MICSSSVSRIASFPREGEEAERAIGAIVDCVREIGARSLFVSWRHDPHCDHEASYRIAREVQRRVGELRLFEYVVWGHTLPPSTEVDPISGFRIRIDRQGPPRRSAAPLPRTARRPPISSTTILPDFDSRRATWPASIFRTNSFLKATHERTAPNAQARVLSTRSTRLIPIPGISRRVPTSKTNMRSL